MARSRWKSNVNERHAERSPYPTLLWTLAVLLLTLTPSDKMPVTPEWQLLSFDTAAHAGVFALLAALAYPWVRTWARRPALLVLLASVALGAAIEALQYAMHLGRHAEWTDLLSDAIGTVLALAAIALGDARRRRLAATAVLALATLAAHAQDAPDLPRARKTIVELASPKMHGRGYVQQGEHKAAAYLRTRLRQLGLQPLAPDYTQPFTLDVNTFPGRMKLTFQVRRSNNARTFNVEIGQAGANYIASPGSAAGEVKNLPVFYLDSTYASHPRYLDSMLRMPARSQAVMLSGRTAAQLRGWPAAIRQHADSCAVRIVCEPKLTASLADHQVGRVEMQLLVPDLYHPEKTPPHCVTLPIFPNQIVSLTLDAQLIRDYQTQNLAAVVRGSTQPDSFVVVTAHYDHLGMMGKNTYFPGANDNASGVALLLELAAHYARPENRPACSVAFLLFGAEEAGLVGSSYFVQHPLLPLSRIKFLLNLDLLGTGEEGATVVNGKVYESAYRQLTALNDAHHYLPRLTARGKAANSDHYPFSEAGVPAFFLYTRGGSLAYHDVNDQPKALSLAGFAGAYGLVRDFLNLHGATPAGK